MFFVLSGCCERARHPLSLVLILGVAVCSGNAVAHLNAIFSAMHFVNGLEIDIEI